MSFLDLYMNKNPMITASDDDSEPVATVFGIPFDSTHSYKPGCRFGPDAIRDSFNNIEIFHPELSVDLETVNIEDLGNARHTVVASEMIEMVKKITSELVAKKRQLFILGGEHSITYGTYTSFPKETGYVVFDAHYDLRDEFADIKLSHASYLRRIVEERGGENILHVGARAFVREELEFLTEHKIKTISDKEIRDGKGPQLLKEFVSTFDDVYSSFDLDVLDPAFAPGVGNPEAVGITTRELFDMIYSFQNTKVTGVDIVELNPYHDNGATASLAAKIMSTLIAINLSQNS
ncbi:MULTISPECIES: agmatinase [Nitrosopumilus]|uniref:Putative agmatinase n=1 Tax=Nitrosopumilus piranensis TaxID=1582439 RepID=A0A0C5BZQ2_9ARCH|nr:MULTISPECIES: agmatinase [Nitrosopumilus]AJM92465.1 putative agmatinase [Nitrosopumilus piranensis]KAF6244369.1 agmatinase [Nitrosopumilus sp. b2]